MTHPNLPQALETALRANNSDDSWGEQHLHVSDLAVALEGSDGKCPRQLWLRLHNAEKKELSMGQLLMFDHGNRIHERAIKLLRDGLPSDWGIERVEWDISEMLEADVRGRLDAWLRSIDGGSVVVDFKTQRGRAFNYLHDAKPSHKLQVRTYSMAVDADYGMVLYLDREGQHHPQQYIVERDDEQVRDAIAVAKSIASFSHPPSALLPKTIVQNRKGPNAIYLKRPWQCNYCDYCGLSCTPSIPEERMLVGHCQWEWEGNIKMDDGFEQYRELVDEEVVEENLI